MQIRIQHYLVNNRHLFGDKFHKKLDNLNKALFRSDFLTLTQTPQILSNLAKWSFEILTWNLHG
jgi:hypothetical protein